MPNSPDVGCADAVPGVKMAAGTACDAVPSMVLVRPSNSLALGSGHLKGCSLLPGERFPPRDLGPAAGPAITDLRSPDRYRNSRRRLTAFAQVRGCRRGNRRLRPRWVAVKWRRSEVRPPGPRSPGQDLEVHGRMLPVARPDVICTPRMLGTLPGQIADPGHAAGHDRRRVAAAAWAVAFPVSSSGACRRRRRCGGVRRGRRARGSGCRRSWPGRSAAVSRPPGRGR